MTARDELNELLRRTNATTGKAVTADEVLSLYRRNPGLFAHSDPARELLERFDREVREEQLRARVEEAERRQKEFLRDKREFLQGMLDDLFKRDDFLYRYANNHQADAFRYAFYGNPFGQSHAQQFRQPPQDPERAKAVAQAKKIKAVVDDLRGDANTRQIAAARLEAMKAKHGLTDRDFR